MLLVLWVTTLMALLAVVVLSTARSDAVMTANRQAVSEAELAAEGGLRTAIFRHLADPREDWQRHGTLFEWQADGATIRAELRDESGRVDLNVAEPETLAAIFAAAGLAGPTADAIAQTIAARRQSNGGERAFLSIAELRHVDGMTDSAMARLAGSVTVFTRDLLPDMAVAPALVRQALGSDAEAGEVTDRLSTVVRISAEAVTGTGYHAGYEAVILRLTDGGPDAYRLLSWAPAPRRLFPALNSD